MLVLGAVPKLPPSLDRPWSHLQLQENKIVLETLSFSCLAIFESSAEPQLAKSLIRARQKTFLHEMKFMLYKGWTMTEPVNIYKK